VRGRKEEGRGKKEEKKEGRFDGKEIMEECPVLANIEILDEMMIVSEGAEGGERGREGGSQRKGERARKGEGGGGKEKG
jgi:hypothetical protein